MVIHAKEKAKINSSSNVLVVGKSPKIAETDKN